ncbi:hypothetical protein [Hymenobacter glacialis]|uniref:Uncharacterized protein n=1 Tax=Hymenobacter glacialis TaxID=1908236 RepID=A0A1G1TBI0_9BACT|nr:hypothetical protein [Hymenobacter glacialis]OGX88206.1 hypothetical protein BEN48_10310 [Hymenobacter glacialis]
MSPQNEEQNDSNSQDPNIGDGASTAMLDAATHGQVLDNNNSSGQEKADEMDDSLRVDTQAMNAAGPAPASAENLPRELTDPSDRAFTLPEEQTPNQG